MKEVTGKYKSRVALRIMRGALALLLMIFVFTKPVQSFINSLEKEKIEMSTLDSDQDTEDTQEEEDTENEEKYKEEFTLEIHGKLSRSPNKSMLGLHKKHTSNFSPGVRVPPPEIV